MENGGTYYGKSDINAIAFVGQSSWYPIGRCGTYRADHCHYWGIGNRDLFMGGILVRVLLDEHQKDGGK